MKIKNIFTVLLVGFILVSCMPASTLTPIETPMIPTATFTLIPPISTSTSTLTSTPTITAFITETPDAQEVQGVYLNAENFSQKIQTEYGGVEWNLELITDKTLDPKIRQITIDDGSLAHGISWELFKVYWNNSSQDHSGLPTQSDFQDFLARIAGSEEDTSFKLKIDNSRDGTGYDNICLMCDPKLVTADSIVIGEIDVVVVNSAKSEDVKILSESGLGFGAKIDYATGRLVIFYSPYRDIMSYPWNIKLNFGQGFGALSSWLIRGVSGHSIDKTTVKIFSDSNLQLK